MTLNNSQDNPQQTVNEALTQALNDPSSNTLTVLSKQARSDSNIANALIQVIETSEDQYLQAAAIRTLGAANPALLIRPLTWMLGSQNYTTRATAAELTGVFGIAELKNNVEGLLRSDTSADVRYWCAVALGQIGDQSSLPVLESQIGNQDWADNQQTVGSAASAATAAIEQRSGL